MNPQSIFIIPALSEKLLTHNFCQNVYQSTFLPQFNQDNVNKSHHLRPLYFKLCVIQSIHHEANFMKNIDHEIKCSCCGDMVLPSDLSETDSKLCVWCEHMQLEAEEIYYQKHLQESYTCEAKEASHQILTAYLLSHYRQAFILQNIDIILA